MACNSVDGVAADLDANAWTLAQQRQPLGAERHGVDAGELDPAVDAGTARAAQSVFLASLVNIPQSARKHEQARAPSRNRSRCAAGTVRCSARNASRRSEFGAGAESSIAFSSP